MFRYALAILFIPTTCFAIQQGSTLSIRFEPGLVAGMTSIVIAQLVVAQLRSQWELAQATANPSQTR